MHKKYPKEVVQYIRDHEHADAVALMLKSSPFEDFSMKEIALQIKGRQIAKSKYPFLLDYDHYRYPAKISLEQSSSEETARFKASLMKGEKFADLTGGMGIDTYIIGQQFKASIYVEPDSDLAANALQNFKTLGFQSVSIHRETAEEYLSNNEQKMDWMYLDPSRRDEGRRIVDITDLQPNVIEILPSLLEQSDNIMVKISPMQDVSSLLQSIKEINNIYYVSLGGEMKEILVHISKNTSIVKHRCVALPDQEIYDFNDENKAVHAPLSAVMRYVYFPDPVFLKSQFQDHLGNHFGLHKLHPNTQIFTSDQLVPDFPGRSYEVKQKVALQKKKISPFLMDEKVNIITKNFPLTPDQIKKKLKTKDGGDDYLIAYTDLNEAKSTLLCQRIIEP